MPDIPRLLVEIVQQLKDGTQPRRASVRSVLKWFGAARRRAGVVAQIEEALRLAVRGGASVRGGGRDRAVVFFFEPSPKTRGGPKGGGGARQKGGFAPRPRQ